MIALEVYKDEETSDKIYYYTIGIVFFLGLFVVIFMVKDRKVPRNYTVDEDG